MGAAADCGQSRQVLPAGSSGTPIVALPEAAARRERSSSHPTTVQEPPHVVLRVEDHRSPGPKTWCRAARARSGL